MRACSFVTLLIGLLLAGGAMYYADQHLARRQSFLASAALPTTTVVVARRDLARGDLLRAEALQEVAWPVESLPEGAFTSIEELIGDGSEERRARRAIVPGEPVLRAKISGFGGGDALGEAVSPGKRAVAIRVNNVDDVASVLLPGDRVDLLLSRQVGDGVKSNLATDAIHQDVVVLTIDADVRRQGRPDAAAATVELAMEDARSPARAMQFGELIRPSPRDVVAREPARTDRPDAIRDRTRERDVVIIRGVGAASN